MNARLLPMIALVLAPVAHAFEPQFRPTLEIRRAEGPIRIDGDLDDAGWQQAARATGFVETSPGDQTEPSVGSEAWVTFDESNLYVALLADDDPTDVRASVCDRDAIFRDDYFGVMIDPYGDHTSGYEFFVNPLGIQGDLRMTGDGNEDESFDAVWSSQGRVTERGYQVEIAIPFSSLRLPNRAEQEWRVNFWRDHQRDVRRKYAWAAQNRDDPCFMCQWGTIVGLRGIETGRRVELIASAIGSQVGTGDPDLGFETDDPRVEAAINAKYALSSGSFAEISVNPDFSQIESDAGRIDVNQTFALFFPERRPFFQEGSDLLGTWISAIYTRSINDPTLAAKFTGQYDKSSVVYTLAQDERSPIIIPGEESSEFLLGEKSVSNIVRVRRSLRQESYVGALATDRRLEGGGSGTTTGLDGLLRSGNYRLELQGLVSRTEEPVVEDEDLEGTFGDGHTVALDGEDYWGHAMYASIERSARTYDADLDYWEYSPEFRTDNGFTTRNDFRQLSFWNGLHLRPNKPWLPEWGPNVGIGRIWNSAGGFEDEWIRPEVWLNTTAQTQLGAQYLWSRERFGGEIHDGIRIWSFWVDSRFSEVLGGGVNVSVGQGVYRDLDAPELANQTNWSADLRFKPAQRLEFNTSLDYARMRSRERAEELFAGYIWRTRADASFTRQLFLRLVVQYNDFSDRVDVEPLLTYRVNPFTMFFLGSSNRFEEFRREDYDALTRDGWQQSNRQFFAKLQYQFHL